jgi:hypothetical protein
VERRENCKNAAKIANFVVKRDKNVIILGEMREKL